MKVKRRSKFGIEGSAEEVVSVRAEAWASLKYQEDGTQHVVGKAKLKVDFGASEVADDCTRFLYPLGLFLLQVT